MPNSDALARRFLHVNLNTNSIDASEALYGGLLGLQARMRTDRNVVIDGSILGLSGETYCQTSFFYDERGGRGGCALEVIEYYEPALVVDHSTDPVRAGLRSALMTVHRLDETADALRSAGFAVGERVTGLISQAPAVLVTDPDGVITEISEGSPTGGAGALFGGVRISTFDAAASGRFLQAIGFVEIQPPSQVRVAGAQLTPEASIDSAVCLVGRYVLPEDRDQFTLVVVEHPSISGDPVPWGGNRQGLYRCALRVESVEAALAQVPADIEVVGPPVWCPLPGTKIDGLYIAFLRSPDGVVFEFVERPLAHFSR